MIKRVWFAFLYLLTRVTYFLCGRNYEILNRYYRKCGATIGKDCLICTPIHYSQDNLLLEIKDDTVVSTNVTFVLHDYCISRIDPTKANLYGRITIGKNCFIGASSVIMYGVEIADNVIVAAGSVVVKSIKESGVIVGGNPARVIGTWDSMKPKIEQYACLGGASVKDLIENHPEKLIKK